MTETKTPYTKGTLYEISVKDLQIILLQQINGPSL